jgi:hypothetical protein
MDILGLRKLVRVLEHKYLASPLERVIATAVRCFDTHRNGTLFREEARQIVMDVRFGRDEVATGSLLASLEAGGASVEGADGVVSLQAFAALVLAPGSSE